MTTMAAVRSVRTEEPHSFDERVRWARKRKHLSQADLAQAIGRSRQSVNGYEQSDKAIPPEETVKSLADALGVTEEFLRFGNKSKLRSVAKAEDISYLPEVVLKDGGYEEPGERHPIGEALLAGLVGDMKSHGRMTLFTLTHDATQFAMAAGSRVIVDDTINGLNNDHQFWLVRSSEGFEVIRREASILAKRGEFAITTGSGESINIKPDQVDVVGPILSALTAMPR